MMDSDEGESCERLNAMAVMRVFDGLPHSLRMAILNCDHRISPFRVRYLLDRNHGPDQVVEMIKAIDTNEELARFHQVAPSFATGKPQPRDDMEIDYDPSRLTLST